MRGVDTNVLVRYVTRDEPRQAELVREAFEEAESRGERLFVSHVVLCELVWVLRGRLYAYDRDEIAGLLRTLLEVALFEVESRDAVRGALEAYARGRGDFADYLIGGTHRAAGCRDTLTFDTRLSAQEGFTHLS